jgi:hypothetical protein
MQRSVIVSVTLLLAVLAACARGPVNSDCEWPSEEARTLDLNNPAAMLHLISDVQLAEELATRFADSEHKRLTGYYGHGGLIDNRRVVNECTAALFGTIASTHQVPMEQVLAVRGARPRAFDVAVCVSFTVLYALLVWAVVPVVCRRFSPDGRWPLLGAFMFGSLVAGATGLQLGELWAVTMEMVRLGNDHLGARGLRIPWGQHRAAIFGVAVGLFWLLATTRLWIGPRRDGRS